MIILEKQIKIPTREEKIERIKKRVLNRLIESKTYLLQVLEEQHRSVYEDPKINSEEILAAFGDDAEELTLIKEKTLELINMVKEAGDEE